MVPRIDAISAGNRDKPGTRVGSRRRAGDSKGLARSWEIGEEKIVQAFTKGSIHRADTGFHGAMHNDDDDDDDDDDKDNNNNDLRGGSARLGGTPSRRDRAESNMSDRSVEKSIRPLSDTRRA
jgi:hypothetical protein